MDLKRADFETAAERSNRPLADEIIPGLLDDGVALMVAKEGTGKTFLGVMMGVHVAAGVPWRDKEVKKGMVVYCIAEGASMFTWRVTTACDSLYRHIGKIPFYILDKSFNLRCKEDGSVSPEVIQFVEIVKGLEVECEQPCRLVVFDTLSRFMPGGDENDQKDAGDLINGVEWIRRQLGCGIVLMHHMRKGGDMVRGSTVLTAAVDEVILCTSDPDDPVQLWTTKDGGKRKDREPVEEWIEQKVVGMTDGEYWPNSEEEEVLHDFSEHIVWKPKFTEEGEAIYEDWEKTVIAVPVNAPSAEAMVKKSAGAAEVIAVLAKGEAVGVRQLMRVIGKSQSYIYRVLDKLVEAGQIYHDPETKKYSWAGPVEPVSPFEGGEK